MFLYPKDTDFMDAPWDPWFEPHRIKKNNVARLRRINRTAILRGDLVVNAFDRSSFFKSSLAFDPCS
jgi:hypothetical protein